MKRPFLTGLLGVAAVLTAAASIAVAQSSQHEKNPLPKGMTEADVQACVKAGTPGPMHESLAKSVGTWHGKSTIWVTPIADPVTSECDSVITPIMDGRFTQCEMTGEMPGMGPFNGLSISGYDNVAQTFQSTWVDNRSTGIMNGTGVLSSDCGTLTWTYTFNCPLTGKSSVMREVQTSTGNESMTTEMYTTDPKTGKEYKMMEIASTRRSDSLKPTSSAR